MQKQTIRDRRINAINSQLEYLDPDFLDQLTRDDLLTHTLAFVTALSPTGLTICESTSDNVLKVATTGSAAETYDVLSGTASGTYSLVNYLTSTTSYTNFDIYVSGVNANVSFRNNVTDLYMADLLVINGQRFIDLNSSAIRIKSTLSGINVNYFIAAYK